MYQGGTSMQETKTRRGAKVYDKITLLRLPEELRMEPVFAKHNAITPGICGGKLRSAGGRLWVWDIGVDVELEKRQFVCRWSG
jgi:hypothetical protein